jgi:glycosyltransferase involved in cell wall biosynthesis
VVEAMTYGLPAVVTDVGGNSEVVVDGHNGLVVEPGSVEQLTHAIKHLLTNGEERRGMGENGRKTAKEFDVDVLMSRLKGILLGEDQLFCAQGVSFRSGKAGCKISAIVCTYNRSQALKRTLESLEAMPVPAGFAWELIVVDNNSTDRTRNVVEEFRKKGALPVRYLFEPKQGLSHARNAGVGAACGEILAFTDDDCLVVSNWLEAIYREFEADRELAGIGGRVELHNPDDAPVTIRPLRERIPLRSPSQFFGLIVGCNMAFKREIFNKIGGFDPSFGSGTRMVADDVDFVYRAFRANFRLLFTPEPLVYHNHGRRTEEQLRPLIKSYVNGRGGFYCKHILRADREILKLAYWEIVGLVKEAAMQTLAGKLASGDLRCLWELLRGAVYRLKEEPQARVRIRL